LNKEEVKSVVRLGSDSIKWSLFGDDVLPLWVADTDFRSPNAVIEALQKRVEHGVLGYPIDPPELGELVAARMAERYGWKVTPKDMLFVPGVVPGFNLACQAVTRPEESLIVQPPVYPPILQAAQNASARSIQAELARKSDGSYEVDYDALEELIEEDTRCLLLCNPHNPVGKVFSRAELEKLAEICLRHNLIICSDEIHSDLVFSGNQHVPIASLSEEIANNTVTLIAPSKTFNIPGLECAVLICTNHELLEKIKHARRGLVGGVNIMGLTAAIAAYRDGDGWLGEMMEILEGNRNFLMEFLDKRIPEVKMYKPDATYLAWLDCSQLKLAGKLSKFFLKKAGVALNNGEDFGPGGTDFVRLNFGCSRELLIDALDRMAKSVKER